MVDPEAVRPIQHRFRRAIAGLGFIGTSRFTAVPLLRARRLGQRTSTIVKAAHVVSSAIFAGIAVELLVTAELGLTPFDALASGLTTHLDLTLGQAGWLLASGLFILAALFGRRPGPWAVGYIFLCGLMIDAIAGMISTPTDVLARFALVLGAVLTMAASIGVIVNSGVGGGPVELLMLAGEDRNVSQRRVRLIFDVAVLVGAVAVDGPLAVGTVVYAVLMGPTIHVVNQAFADHRAGRELRLVSPEQIPSPV